ncbi:MAG: SAM-dependent methyltransferase [Myxococcota bacterium]|jgi:SAM-dependent methyltransferase
MSDPYGSAELYDLEYSDMTEDLEHYVRLARRYRFLLELGCGTGRLTLPMARTGAGVHGIDHSAQMLAGLERRLRLERPQVRYRVQYQQGDFRSFDPPARYPLVIWPFNALHHCTGPEDVVRVLDNVRDCLMPSGLLGMDCYLPDIELYDRDPNKRYEFRTFADPRTGEPLQSWEQGWWNAETRVHHVLYVYRHADGREEKAHLQLRMFELDELRALIRNAGWRIRSQASDFQGTPVTQKSLKWVAILDRR